MIVIDGSALVAILRDEPERRAFIDAIVDHGEPRLSAATYVEASMVMELRLGDRGDREIDVLMEDVDRSQAGAVELKRRRPPAPGP